MNKSQCYNPFLPLSECIPDGEPHVFDGRVYLFGSHERLRGEKFCCEPYVFYSAPVDDLSRWTARGPSYSAAQDPHSTPERNCIYAPDVVRGNDGRFYLYYCLDGYAGPLSAAVCDTPDGKYEYLGDVRDPDGKPFQRFIPFDPAVLNDDGTIRLYYGTWFPFADNRTEENTAALDAAQQQIFGKTLEEIKGEPGGVGGPVTVELADDMLTVITEPKRIMPARVKGTSWEEHPFFEGSSIRRIGGLYYFIYSSWNNHELCYATSSRPDEGFVFRGTIVSNGDVGYKGRTMENKLNATGNTHGSIEKIDGQWYIFYHRHTHGTDFSRQPCAEPIEILPDGSIPQVEMTSCGLNGGPLRAEGRYPAAICCNLTHGQMPHSGTIKDGNAPASFPFISSEGNSLFVHNIEMGTWIGYKYFDFQGSCGLELTYRGDGQGQLAVSTALEGETLAVMELEPSSEWQNTYARIPFPEKKGGLFLHYEGSGNIDLLSFTLS